MSESDHGSTTLTWTAEIDRLLASWCDEAKCFEWMHTEAYTDYDKRARQIMITSNVLTAIVGLSNVIAGGQSINGFQLAWIFGGFSVAVSITNMLQEKLGYATKATEHLQYATQWSSVRRRIEEQVAIPWSARKDCGTFLKYVRTDIDAVSKDGNIKIPERVRKACYERFSKIQGFDVPDICGDLEHTRVYVAAAEPLLSPPS
jgi:hypothetical protein